MTRLVPLCLVFVACGETEPQNQSPMVVSPIPDIEMATMADSAFNISEHFTDGDGDTLMYRAEAMDPTVANAVVNGAILRLTTFDKVNSTDIEVVAMDPDAAEASLTFKVEVRAPPIEWRENFDSAGALNSWDIDSPDGSRVEVDEEAGSLLLHLPTDDYNVVRAHAREVVGIGSDWVASTYMGLRDGDLSQCSEFIVHTGDATYPSWQFEIDHFEGSFLIYIRYSGDNWWHDIWEGYLEDYTNDFPGVGDYYDLALSIANDTLTVMYNDTVQIARFHPKDDGDEWPGNGDVPATATGVALGGSNCFGEGTVRADFVEIKEIGD